MKIEVEEGSLNFFADLMLADAREILTAFGRRKRNRSKASAGHATICDYGGRVREVDFRRVIQSLMSSTSHRKRGVLLPVCCRKEPGKVRKSAENAARKFLTLIESVC